MIFKNNESNERMELGMSNIVRISVKAEEGKPKKRNVYVQSASDVKRLLNNTINELRNGEIDSKSANSIGYLANILLKVFETEEVIQKVKELEEKFTLITDHSRP
ncbi:hypothetical protein EB820_19570 [Brevibacillus agri]|uniref:Uncharacterized protein n=2 Tax=Brevibacillus agri TaxID=51101 RepID=A0A3M8AKF5_9BACL|nr:hypothetical protein BA6348_03245 [Brevibacillus agri]RNB51706.1 hypothetical protein EB820_19570 [Brevibacillus agri]